MAGGADRRVVARRAAGSHAAARAYRWSAGCAVAAARDPAHRALPPAHPSFGPLAVSLAVAGARLRGRRRPGHHFGARPRPAGALGYGGLRDQHQPRARRRLRRRRARGARQRAPDERPRHAGCACSGYPRTSSRSSSTRSRRERPDRRKAPGRRRPATARSSSTSISAAYGAFHAGLTTALLSAAILILIAGIGALAGGGAGTTAE